MDGPGQSCSLLRSGSVQCAGGSGAGVGCPGRAGWSWPCWIQSLLETRTQTAWSVIHSHPWMTLGLAHRASRSRHGRARGGVGCGPQGIRRRRGHAPGYVKSAGLLLGMTGAQKRRGDGTSGAGCWRGGGVACGRGSSCGGSSLAPESAACSDRAGRPCRPLHVTNQCPQPLVQLTNVKSCHQFFQPSAAPCCDCLLDTPLADFLEKLSCLLALLSPASMRPRNVKYCFCHLSLQQIILYKHRHNSS